MLVQTEKLASAVRSDSAAFTHGAGRTVGFAALVFLVVVLTAMPASAASAAPTGESALEPTDEDGCVAVAVTGLDSVGLDEVAEEVPSALDDGQRLVSHLDLPRRAPGIAFVVGYERRANGDALDNEVRAHVYRHVVEVPGRSIADLVRASGVDRSTLRYHVRILDRAGLVESRSVLGHHRVYPTPVDDRATAPAAALATQSTERVVRAVERLQPVGTTDLGSELGLATSTVSSHVDRLVAAGVLTREYDGRAVFVRLSPETRAFLD
ncbi:hypothetical protein C2R22_00485 [Salinigranum rubrum]|uniref:HTH arsR-type domain-containing protein n=1 Tax=Salinigranum rubrum TaxID=755307 RepID=A0A2I8VEI8_9EURY|nr:helix-turn-helix domain-containing protein [Salinigranum rubrum]AUV80321.1 hypothetical protein C2R22_00485 [Salinigranum rubrum]